MAFAITNGDDSSEPGCFGVHFSTAQTCFCAGNPLCRDYTKIFNVEICNTSRIYILCNSDEIAIVLKIDWDKGLSDHSKGNFEIVMLVTYAISDLKDQTLQCAISVPLFGTIFWSVLSFLLHSGNIHTLCWLSFDRQKHPLWSFVNLPELSFPQVQM